MPFAFKRLSMPRPPRWSRQTIVLIVVLGLLVGVSCISLWLGLRPAHSAQSPTITANNAATQETAPTGSSSALPQETTPKSGSSGSNSSGQSPSSTKTTPKAAPQTADDYVAQANDDLKSYGITLTLNPDKGDAYATWDTLEAADKDTLIAFLPTFVAEYKKYPTDFVRGSGVKKIGLVRKLAVSGQFRAAAPSPQTTAMLYDVKTLSSSGDAYTREVIHHEYWHYIDFVTKHSYYFNDSTWEACNPSGFTYGNGGYTAYNETNFINTYHPSDGFITHYATYGEEEDRAEMFGELMYKPSRVHDLYASDPRLKCKADRLAAFAHVLSPGMSF